MVTSPAAPLALSPHTQPVQTRHGLMRANPDDFHPGRALLEYGECCELESAVLRQLLVRPGVVVEVGANIGVHTVALAREARPRRQVRVAFEPQPVIFQNLGANLAANGITNVLAWPCAAGLCVAGLCVAGLCVAGQFRRRVDAGRARRQHDSGAVRSAGRRTAQPYGEPDQARCGRVR
jgi:hypothetical protein